MKQYNRQASAHNTRIEASAQLLDAEVFEQFETEQAHKARVNELLNTYSEDELFGLWNETLDMTIGEAWHIAYERKHESEQAFFERQLWEFYEEVKNSDPCEWWDMFSDMYKDTYGFRPRFMR